MIDSLNHIEAEDFDQYNRRRFSHRSKNRRLKKRRKPSIYPRGFGFPIKVKVPTKKQPKIVKGMPNKAVKLSPVKPAITVTNTGVIKPKSSTLLVKQSPSKKTVSKIDIDTLIDKTNTAPQKSQVSKPQEKETVSDKAQKNVGMASDSKVSKIVKVIAGIGLMGVTGYIIYRVVKHQKLKKTRLKK